MKSHKISIIIPTYNRKNKLYNTLNSIMDSSFKLKDAELIIIDDGSNDGTKEMVNIHPIKEKLNLIYIYQNNQGPGIARNNGINVSKSNIILFCGDDTLFHKDLLKKHCELHEQFKNMAVLGLCLWDENVKVNSFMRYIAPYGPQFHYNTIRKNEDAGFSHFYTCNLSIEKSYFNDVKFDSRFKYAAFEDIDVGYILEKKGLKIFYSEDAVVYHSHEYDPDSFYKRMINVGRSQQIFIDKHRDFKLKVKYSPFDILPGNIYIFKFLSKILSNSSIIKKINVKWHWYFNICYYYSEGICLEKSRKINSISESFQELII